MDELFPSPAAGFDHPIEILEGCHARIRRNCALVERIARHVATKGADDEARQAIRSVMRYFDEAGANHHRDEEEDLFPALERRAARANQAPVAALLERLRREHGELDALWKEMRGRLEGLAGGHYGAVTPDAALLFARAYETHMKLEEESLFPAARRLLDAPALEALGASMAARRGVVPPPQP